MIKKLNLHKVIYKLISHDFIMIGNYIINTNFKIYSNFKINT